MRETIEKSDNTLFPVFIKLEKLQVLIVGGGLIGYEKIRTVLNCNPQADVTLIAISILPELITFVKDFPNVKLIQKAFDISDLEDKDLVIAAVNDKALSGEIKNHAKSKKILINVADTPDLCDFYLGSIVKKGNLKIAISTNGKSPTIAKRLKEVFSETLPDELGEVLDNMHIIRNQMKGDFAAKVSTLNSITKDLAARSESKKKDWLMVASLAFFALYLIAMLYMLLPHTWIGSFKESILHVNNSFCLIFTGATFSQLLNVIIVVFTDLSCVINMLFAFCLWA